MIEKLVDKTVGVEKRTREANIGTQLKNGSFTSDRALLSKDQVNKRLKADDIVSGIKTGADVTKNTTEDYLQSALNNLGSPVIRSGGVNNAQGYMAPQRPFLIMRYASLSLPDNYGHYYGYPCNMTLKLGDLSGFTKVKDCHLDGFSCSKTEMDEIEALLKEGIII